MYKILFIFLSFFILTLSAHQNSIKKKVFLKIDAKYDAYAIRRVKALNKLMNSIMDSKVKEKLEKVNNFFNQMQFTTDKLLWGKDDYWATRKEFLEKGAGDCEDFVIAKYFTLKQLGVPINKLFFTYVKAIKLKQAHMVLTYYKTPVSVPLVLDNINPKILPATMRKDLIPVYSFNGDSLYLAKQQGLGRIIPKGMKKNKKWFSLIDKIRREKHDAF